MSKLSFLNDTLFLPKYSFFILSINLNTSRKQGWESEWIDTAEDLLRTQYKSDYLKVAPVNTTTSTTQEMVTKTSRKKERVNIFDELLDEPLSTAHIQDEIDRYLSTEHREGQRSTGMVVGAQVYVSLPFPDGPRLLEYPRYVSFLFGWYCN